MSRVPVICQNCDSVYEANILAGAILKDTRLGNNPIPCPFCGKTGFTVEGLYSNVSDAVQLIKKHSNSINTLTILSDKFELLKNNDLNTSVFKKQLQQDLPELEKLSDVLPKTRTELYAFVGIIIAILTLLISNIDSSTATAGEITNEKVIEATKELSI